MSHSPRLGLLSITIAAALVLTGSAVALSTDEDDPGSVCEAIGVVEINGLSTLQFSDPVDGTGYACYYTEPSTQLGRYAVFLRGIDDVTLDDIRLGNPDAFEIEVGDRAGIATVTKRDGTYLYIGVAGIVLQINVDIADSAAAEGTDPVGFGIDIATVAVANLEAAAADHEAAPAVPASDPLADPPTVEGVAWSGFASGRDGADMSEEEIALFEPLLKAAGAGSGQLSTLSSDARDAETNERIGSYLAIRLAGVDESVLGSAILEWLRQGVGSDISVEEASIEGKDVTMIAVSPEEQGFLYVSGDTAYLLEMPDEQAAQVLELLP